MRSGNKLPPDSVWRKKYIDKKNSHKPSWFAGARTRVAVSMKISDKQTTRLVILWVPMPGFLPLSLALSNFVTHGKYRMACDSRHQISAWAVKCGDWAECLNRLLCEGERLMIVASKLRY